jgi:hypothetical protein
MLLGLLSAVRVVLPPDRPPPPHDTRGSPLAARARPLGVIQSAAAFWDDGAATAVNPPLPNASVSHAQPGHHRDDDDGAQIGEEGSEGIRATNTNRTEASPPELFPPLLLSALNPVRYRARQEAVFLIFVLVSSKKLHFQARPREPQCRLPFPD